MSEDEITPGHENISDVAYSWQLATAYLLAFAPPERVAEWLERAEITAATWRENRLEMCEAISQSALNGDLTKIIFKDDFVEKYRKVRLDGLRAAVE